MVDIKDIYIQSYSYKGNQRQLFGFIPVYFYAYSLHFLPDHVLDFIYHYANIGITIFVRRIVICIE